MGRVAFRAQAAGTRASQRENPGLALGARVSSHARAGWVASCVQAGGVCPLSLACESLNTDGS